MEQGNNVVIMTNPDEKYPLGIGIADKDGEIVYFVPLDLATANEFGEKFSSRFNEALQRIRTASASERRRGEMELLPEKSRVRHKRVPELTGTIEGYEYYELGNLSPIPYRIRWDDSSLAAAELGWLFIYATEDCVEPLTPPTEKD